MPTLLFQAFALDLLATTFDLLYFAATFSLSSLSYRKDILDRDVEAEQYTLDALVKTHPLVTGEAKRLEKQRPHFDRPYEVWMYRKDPATQKMVKVVARDGEGYRNPPYNGCRMYDFKPLTGKEARKQFMLYNNIQMAKEMVAAERHRAATRRLLEEAAQRANDARKLALVKTAHLKLEERVKLLSTSGASRSAPLFSCGESILQWWQNWMPGCHAFPTRIGISDGSSVSTKLPRWYLGEVAAKACEWRENYWWGGHQCLAPLLACVFLG